MSEVSSNIPELSSSVKFSLLLLVVGLSVFPGLSVAETPDGERELSQNFSMKLDEDAKATTGEEEYGNIVHFFHQAERAIEAEDIEALMSLYSERYTNLNGEDRQFARGIWLKIFDNFDNLSAKHAMRLLTYQNSDEGQVAVAECFGLLSGFPKETDKIVTIDSWDRQRHILIKEGVWKLFGNAGKGSKRYGEEEFETHPLF